LAECMLATGQAMTVAAQSIKFPEWHKK
jgi:hypothetical protein